MRGSILVEYCFSCMLQHFDRAKAAIADARHLAGKQINAHRGAAGAGNPRRVNVKILLPCFHPFQTIAVLIRTNVPSNSILTGPFQPVYYWFRTSVNDYF